MSKQKIKFAKTNAEDLINDEEIFKAMTFGDTQPSPIDERDFVACVGNAEKVSFPKEYLAPQTEVFNQGAIGSCHDKETQVLTKTGWKYFKDVTKDDLLASVNPETNTIIFENPTDLISYKYTGEMIVGKHTSLDFMVTPNHNMLVRKWDENKRTLSDKYTFIEADKLGCYCGLMSTFDYKGADDIDDSECIILGQEKLANGNILPEIKINLHDWVQFLGIYLAEGTLCKTLTSKKTFAYRIQLAAVKDREANYISSLLQKMGIQACYHKKDRFVFSNKRIFNKLSDYGLFGVKAKDKFIPDFIFDLDSSYLKEFLFGFGMGDGHKCGLNKWQYYTSSQKLAEQLQIVSLLAGKWNKITIRQPREAHFKGHIVPVEQVLPSYTIAERINTLSITRKHNIHKEFYDDYVYCATMPTYHTLITKRNENILVSGNCVAHSCATAMAQGEEVLKQAHNEYSRGYIYGNRKDTDAQGEGMIMRQALKQLHNCGDVLYEDFPYNKTYPKVKELIEQNKEELAAKALPHAIVDFYRCFDENQIKNAIVNAGGVLICVPVYANFARDLHTPENTNSLQGYHAMIIVGWNADDKWIVQNSWGTSWGYDGKLLMDKDYPVAEYWGITVNADGIEPQPKKKSIFYKIAGFFGWIINSWKNIFKTIFKK